MLQTTNSDYLHYVRGFATLLCMFLGACSGNDGSSDVGADNNAGSGGSSASIGGASGTSGGNGGTAAGSANAGSGGANAGAAGTSNQGQFAETGSMTTARAGHSATLLPSGKVLIAGGDEAGTAELYNPDLGVFEPTGTMTVKRVGHSATLLAMGKVLITGGSTDGSDANSLASAELYDPATGTFVSTGSMSTARRRHTATLLLTGQTLIVGGDGAGSAEIYDPNLGDFSVTGSPTIFRTWFSATLLNSGKVLIAGGFEDDSGLSAVVSVAELYAPETGTFSTTGSLASGRGRHTATLLQSGEVLLVAGDDNIHWLNSAELYQPDTGLFIATGNSNYPRSWGHRATLLGSNNVLITGGIPDYYPAAAIYDRSAGTFARTADTTSYRSNHTSTLLKSNKVLLTGGAKSGIDPDATAELYSELAGRGFFTDPIRVVSVQMA